MIACLFSCEHATCAVPEAFRDLFRGSEEIVASNKGWDPGALNLAQGFAMKFRTPLIHGDVTRLLIDLNESGDERWSKFSRTLPEATRTKLVDRHQKIYRGSIRARIAEDLQRHEGCLHLMLHTEESDQPGIILEVGQARGMAEDFATKWKARLVADGLDVQIVWGTDGGLAEELVAAHDVDRYALLRLKVPQSYFLDGKPLRWETLKKILFASLAQIAGTYEMPVKSS